MNSCTDNHFNPRSLTLNGSEAHIKQQRERLQQKMHTIHIRSLIEVHTLLFSTPPFIKKFLAQKTFHFIFIEFFARAVSLSVSIVVVVVTVNVPVSTVVVTVKMFWFGVKF
jgi:hypothetical protein